MEAIWQEAEASAAARARRAVGSGQELVPARGAAAGARPSWRRARRHARDDRPFQALAQALLPDLAGDAQAVQDLLALRGTGRRGRGLVGALAPAPRARPLGRGPVRGAVHPESAGGANGLRRSRSAGSSWRPTCTCCCRCATTSCSTATPTRRCGRSSPTSRCSAPSRGRRCAGRSCSRPSTAATASRTRPWSTRCWRRSRASAEPCRSSPSPPPSSGSRRDRERGVLTREAYAAIGGVGGALAQHAEATLERIGQERVPIVRELFRNLVTAQKTRATVDREELLSVFAGEDAGPGRDAAARVLDVLVDARLLTSYELPEAGGRERRPPPHRDHPRVAALAVAAARALAGAGPGRGAAARPAPAGRRGCGRSGAGPRTCCGPAPPSASTSCGGSATRASSRRPRRPSRVR